MINMNLSTQIYKRLISVTIAFVALLLVSTQAFAASLSVMPNTTAVEVGDDIVVNIELDTLNVDTVGSDVIVDFDAAKLQVKEADLADLYSTKVTDGSVSYGKVIFEAVALGSETFAGVDTFATITFTAIADGTANIELRFVAAGDSTDSNVTADDIQGTDLLTQVNDASIVITPATTTTPTSTESATTGIGGGTTEMPVSGNVENTLILLLGGLTALGIGTYIKTKQLTH
jgi:hypothetical protein